MNYSEKLKDPRWQKKRLEILDRDMWKCKSCGDDKKTLHVHHIFYMPRKDPWDIPNGLLITLCEGCHKSMPEEDEEISIPDGIINDISNLLNIIWSHDHDGMCDYTLINIADHLNDPHTFYRMQSHETITVL
jgi:hypothetical protein